jgi:hypothetical protein
MHTPHEQFELFVERKLDSHMADANQGGTQSFVQRRPAFCLAHGNQSIVYGVVVVPCRGIRECRLCLDFMVGEM